MIENIKGDTGLRHAAEPSDVEYGRLVTLLFTIFFIVALVTRLLPRSMRPLASAGNPGQSVYQEAKQAAHNVAPFAFMSF